MPAGSARSHYRTCWQAKRGPRRTPRGAESAGAGRPPQRAAGQSRHLPLSARRPEPDGSLRHETRPSRMERQAVSRTDRSPFRSCHAETCSAPPSDSGPAANAAWSSPRCCRTRARIADEITLVRSMMTDVGRSRVGPAADPQRVVLRRQAERSVRGSCTAWARCEKGLPAYVVLSDPGGLPIDGTKNWTAGFLPAIYQGTPFRSSGSPVLHLRDAADVAPEARRRQLDFLRTLNADHLAPHPGQFRAGSADRQLRAGRPHADLRSRRDRHLPRVERHASLYGLDRPETAEYGNGACSPGGWSSGASRFVQIFLSGQPWDTHAKNAEI